ncbi:glycosyltransferase family 4 protein [Phaeodactylibacter luteus]|uniref:Glycosyltransferase family 4 protein n=1 Tax=Phaeodactylibacter luteus TaxID=1564516 RepID=A0A5C6S807_9BACT|nr:glycosyltransferase family 4 protein [Phaeodactylibacter luteus]TXB70201.1 glycosyltransferase family 4 protein [Phaeodactylibacter luteus]
MEKIICTVTNDLTYDQRMIRICRSLSRRGYEVVLVGRVRTASRPLSKEPFRQIRLRCRWQSGKLFYLEYNIRLFLWLSVQRFDALCAVDLDTLLPAWLWCALRRKPCIYDAHEYFTEVPEVVRRPIVQRVWEGLARTLIPRIQYAYTVGGELARVFQARYGVPFEVIRNVPLPRPVPAVLPRPEPRILLYQGALNEGRGLEVAIAALPHLPGTTLWLAGEGDCSDALRQQAATMGLSGRVRFWGYLTPDALAELTPKASIGLNLLENKGLSYYFSLANKTFDYMQAGLPGLHMAFPEYKALYKQHPGFVLLEQLTPEAIAGAVRPLLDDTAWYEKIQGAALHAAEALHWGKEEEKLFRFYDAVFGH